MQFFDVIETLDHYGIYYEESFNSDDLLILCPFHNDRNIGSAKFDKETGLFNCYSCGSKGNVFQFVAQLEDITVKEAGVLLENNFEEVDVYDIEKLKDRVTRIRIVDEFKEYRALAQKVTMRILFEMRNYDLPKEFVQRWILINSWILNIPKVDVNQKYKQILNIYSTFTNERNYYE